MMTPDKKRETVAALVDLLAQLETMSPLQLVNGGAKNVLKRAVGISGDLMRDVEARLAALEAAERAAANKSEIISARLDCLADALASLISNGPQA
jgi:hypothetical protein